MTRGLRLPLSDKDVKNLIYGFYKREVEVRKRAFRFTAELRNNISRIGDFLTTEDNYYGLFMPGTVGNGKTTMMRAIKDLFVYLIDKEKITYQVIYIIKHKLTLPIILIILKDLLLHLMKQKVFMKQEQY